MPTNVELSGAKFTEFLSKIFGMIFKKTEYIICIHFLSWSKKAKEGLFSWKKSCKIDVARGPDSQILWFIKEIEMEIDKIILRGRL